MVRLHLGLFASVGTERLARNSAFHSMARRSSGGHATSCLNLALRPGEIHQALEGRLEPFGGCSPGDRLSGVLHLGAG